MAMPFKSLDKPLRVFEFVDHQSAYNLASSANRGRVRVATGKVMASSDALARVSGVSRPCAPGPPVSPPTSSS